MPSDFSWAPAHDPTMDPREDLVKDADVWTYVVEHTQDPEKKWFWHAVRCAGIQFTKMPDGSWTLMTDQPPNDQTAEQIDFRTRYMLPETEYIIAALTKLGEVYDG